MKRPSWALQEPGWLTSIREGSLNRASTLPDESNLLYVKHSIPLELNIDELLDKIEPPGDPRLSANYRRMVEESEDPVIIHVDAGAAACKVPKDLSSMGLVVLPIPAALSHYGDIIREAIQRSGITESTSKHLHLTLSLLNSGIFIYAPKEMKEPAAIRSIWISESSEHVTSSISIIVADSKAPVSVIEEYDSPEGNSKGRRFFGHLILALVNEEANLKHALFNNFGGSVETAVFKRSTVGRYARQEWIGGILGGGVNKYVVDNYLVGEGARGDTLEVVMGNGGQKFDATVNLHHIASHTTGRAIAKSICMDRAVTYFKGIIGIEKQAKNTSAYLAEHAMLLSSEARASAIPGLEVKSDNVKATHSASVSQIDEDHIWYLMCRGIPRNDAIKMVALGFFEPVISEIDITQVRWNMRYQLERKWLGPRGEELSPEQLMDVYIEPEDVGKSVEDIFGTHYKYVYKR
ncbi:MAG: SufD family Fe-S cluster assembly protein [Aigarchaeota archaeon]|nr:SufD family Fe-S cluster assembly protein [Aigarchaeota archaeon]MDW8092737.1 SufD family Fe-S cluster assembly protein [Nitrososphaerota archaeon]